MSYIKIELYAYGITLYNELYKYRITLYNEIY